MERESVLDQYFNVIEVIPVESEGEGWPDWFVETYVKIYTQRKYCLTKATTLLVRNTVEGCQVYMYYNEGLFCPCCGMQLRVTPSNKEDKDRLRRERRIAKIRKENSKDKKGA